MIDAPIARAPAVAQDFSRAAPRFAHAEGFEDEDFIADETVAVTISNLGYVKRMTLDEYRSQRRGGSGIRGSDTREGDIIERLFLADTHDSLLFFTGSGKAHQLKVFRLPNLGRTAVGRAAVNLIPGFPAEDSIQAVIPVRTSSRARCSSPRPAARSSAPRSPSTAAPRRAASSPWAWRRATA
jgi:DNA gyrase/topoisomerase IV subunit A